MINIVTGYQGKPHLEAAEQGLFNAGICGNSVVLPTNNRLAYTLNSNNSITIQSGDLVNQGRHITIPFNSSETLTIENGKTGYNRIDTVIVRYRKNPETSVESSEVLVIKGTAVADTLTAQPPELIHGDIFSGAAQDDFPLYDIHIQGLNVEQVIPRFLVIMSADELTEKSNELTEKSNELTEKSKNTVTKNAITACNNSNVVLSASNTEQKVNVSVHTIVGDSFSVENGSIKVGAGINKVLLQGNLYYRPAENDGKTIIVYKNSTPVAIGYVNHQNAIDVTVSVPAKLIDVKAGDTISLYAEGSKNDVIVASSSRTYLTVQAVG